jgi:hypothetical protein
VWVCVAGGFSRFTTATARPTGTASGNRDGVVVLHNLTGVGAGRLQGKALSVALQQRGQPPRAPDSDSEARESDSELWVTQEGLRSLCGHWHDRGPGFVV